MEYIATVASRASLSQRSAAHGHPLQVAGRVPAGCTCTAAMFWYGTHAAAGRFTQCYAHMAKHAWQELTPLQNTHLQMAGSARHRASKARAAALLRLIVAPAAASGGLRERRSGGSLTVLPAINNLLGLC